MKVSTPEQVCDMYQQTAADYSAMMAREIELAHYSDVLGRLAKRLAPLPGYLIDTACGSGHMLARYRKEFDHSRTLIGIDLAPAMIDSAASLLGSEAVLFTGDMAKLTEVATDGNTAGIISYFALHHLAPEQIARALEAWYCSLCTGGQLLLATWEGNGAVDYGDSSEVVACRYPEAELRQWVEAAGFTIDRCRVEAVEGMPMQAIYLEATRR